MSQYVHNMQQLEDILNMTDDELSHALLMEEHLLASERGNRMMLMLCEASRRALKNCSKTDEKCEKSTF